MTADVNVGTENASQATLVRLALGGVESAAMLEAKERALSKLATDLLAGREGPLDLATIHTELEAVASTETSSQRGLSAVWRAAQTLEQLDMDQAEPEASETGEPDPFFELDLWGALIAVKAWQHRVLTKREERALGRIYSTILAANDPVQALNEFRRAHGSA